ncbi:hypothetical protein ANN_27483 [Periplaneta americana]|uniref:Uncharacterized protein n=1 Tax=Periplaneta americana TaxID=6978 RepID=A0ABQ8RW21_PERAM|nr:hypothetical protein ANN_27483 [Periplaneta americana]
MRETVSEGVKEALNHVTESTIRGREGNLKEIIKMTVAEEIRKTDPRIGRQSSTGISQVERNREDQKEPASTSEPSATYHNTKHNQEITTTRNEETPMPQNEILPMSNNDTSTENSTDTTDQHTVNICNIYTEAVKRNGVNSLKIKTPTIVGTKQINTEKGAEKTENELQGGTRRAWLYIGRLHQTTTQEKIKRHLTKLNITNIVECEKLQTKGTLKAYKVGIPLNDLSKIDAPEYSKINFLLWNVEGLKSILELAPNELLAKRDVLILTETFMTDNIDIPGCQRNTRTERKTYTGNLLLLKTVNRENTKHIPRRGHDNNQF